jgi:broad specificity phosphatase PhoE
LPVTERSGHAATTFHLVRHASYDMLGRVLAGRTPGHALNATGRAEAARLAQTLASGSISAIVSSPLERAQETARIIAARLALPVETEPALNEIDFGEWTGMTFEALHAMPAWQVFNIFRGAACIPGGETMLAAQARSVEALARLRLARPGQQVVVVSHGDVVKALIAHFLGISLDLFRRIEIAPASRSLVWLADSDVRVNGVNLPPGA